MASLAKVLLAFEHGVIPRHLHFRDPSPHIPWASLPVRVVSEATEWPRPDRAPVAGVRAFGFSGPNAHVIVEAPLSARTRSVSGKSVSVRIDRGGLRNLK